MFDFWTPRLIARAAPAVKLLIIVPRPDRAFRSGIPHRLSRTAHPVTEPAVADAFERGRTPRSCVACSPSATATGS
jgi:hypothetical protein